MLNIFADALLIATRMNPPPRQPTEVRPQPEGDYAEHRMDPPSRHFTLMGMRI